MSRLLLIALAVAAGGCGGDDYSLAPVSGTVTLDGVPVAGARIGFEPVRREKGPEAGPGSYGRTDEQGRYQLKSLHGDEGAVIGTHIVSISTFEDEELPDGQIKVITEERIPERYRLDSRPRFDVPADGTEAADFKLTSS